MLNQCYYISHGHLIQYRNWVYGSGLKVGWMTGQSGSLFWWVKTSGSYPQTKLSGCDPDISCSLKNSVDI